MNKIGFYSPKSLGVEKKGQYVDKKQPVKNSQQLDFKSILKEELKKNEGLKFSAHAQSRLISRNIVLNDNDIQKLEEGVRKAEEKGAKESLVLMKDMAFIVSIPNKTVITVANRETAQENIFTNIDSTIIL